MLLKSIKFEKLQAKFKKAFPECNLTREKFDQLVDKKFSTGDRISKID